MVILSAELPGEIRDRIAISGVKATVKVIEAQVVLNVKRRELGDVVLKAKHDLGIIVAARQTIYSKKDCMLALGQNWRAEMDTGLSVKGKVDRAKQQMEDLYKGRE